MTLLGSEHSLLIRSKFRSVLQLRLQQRRTQEQLANQGIIPSLKSSAEFHVQRKHLDSDKTEDILKRKVRNRPNRTDLFSMHILQASTSERSVSTAQMKLKRARLADDLNEKIALRPGPLELVEKNILPVDSVVKEAIKGNKVSFSKSADAFAFEEDSSDGLSPEQTRSEDPQGSVGSPPDTKATETPLGTIQDLISGSENERNESTSQFSNQPDAGKQGLGPLSTPIPVQAAVKSKALGDSKNRHKKPKDPKPKVKKLKYHQYIPPDQKADKSPPPMDSAYARLLQQQQLFLQLQILSQQQQQHRFNYSGMHQTQLKEPNEQIVRNPHSSSAQLSNTPLSPCVKSSFSGQTGISSLKPGPLPSNLDDLKVSELRQQLRMRGLPVSGTKTALMDRLRPFQDCSGNSMLNFSDITTVTFPVTPTSAPSNYQSSPSTSTLSNSFYHFGSTSSSPPISPASSDLSVTGSLPDTFNDTSPSFGLHPSPVHGCTEESLMSSLNGGSIPCELDGLDSEKDKMLVEKQKVINELTWKLQQEQRQVEELRMQLQKQKRSNCSEKKPLTFLTAPIKQEHAVSSCPFASQQISVKRQSNGPEGQPSICDAAQLLPLGNTHFVESSGQTNILSSTFLSPQCSPQHSPLQAVKSPQHISLPPSPNNQYFLPSSSGAQGDGQRVSSPVSSQVCTAQNSVPHESHPPSFSPQPSSLNSPFLGVQADSCYSSGGNPCPKSPGIPQKITGLSTSDKSGPKFSIPSPTFPKSTSAVTEITQPPSYEDAVKQQITRSQQMDELLDVLIESGELPADVREDNSCLQKVPKIPGTSHSPSAALPKHLASFDQVSSELQLPLDQYGTDNDEHLEVLLNSHSPLGKMSDVTLLKIGSEEPLFDGVMDGLSGKTAEDLFNTQEILTGPLSPMHTQFSHSSMDSNGLPLSFTESPWETMEWLDLTPPNSTPGFSSLPTNGPNIFNIDFLDVTDLNLNSPMDLHLQQW